MFQKFNSIITIFLIIFIINISLGNQLFAAGQQEPLFSLPEVVIIASKYPQELLESVASVKIISKEEILSSQSQNLAGIISNIAGIEVTDYGSPGDIKSLSIRGSSPEQVLVMIDGQVVNDQQTGKIDLGIIPTSIIEKIEIYRGPASALYGANALGGVINIVTKKGNGEKNLATGLYYGSNQTQKYQISYQNRGAEWNYFFTGEYYQTQGERENSQLDRISLFGKISKELDQYTNLDLTIRYIDYQRGIPGPAYYPSPLAQQEDRNFNLNLQWQKKEEDKDINVIAWYDFKTLSYDDPNEWEYPGASLNRNHALGISFDCTYYDFNWSNLREHDGTNILTWGGELKNNWVNSSEIGKQQTFNGAIFLQNAWQPTELENLNITLGMRYDYHQIFGGQFSPRIGLSYNLQKDISFHASVAHAYRTPTFNDLFWPEDGYVGGNPNLVPETAWAYEAGIRYIDEKGDTQTELNLFRKNVNNLINWAADSKEVWRPTNIGSARLNGVEVILMKKLNDYLAADLNYTYLDAIDLDLGTQLKPKHKYGLGITYLNKFGRNEDDLTIGFKGYLVTGRPDNLNNYYLFDTNLDRDFTIDKEKNRKVKLSLTIKNLFDQKPELVSGYPVQGRTFLLGISTDF